MIPNSVRHALSRHSELNPLRSVPVEAKPLLRPNVRTAMPRLREKLK